MVTLRKEIKGQVAKLVRQAGRILLQEFKKTNLKAKFKSKHEIVTVADLISEKFILEKLKTITPDWRIVSEEKGDNHKKSDYTWFVDPLDGTTNFYMGNPLFAVQIALLYKNEILLSLIYAPAINEFYWAAKGQGAYLNGKKIKISKHNFSQALLTYCHGNSTPDLKKALKLYQHFKLHNFDIRQIGSAALEFAWVAKGKTDCYISPGTRPWDVIPGILLVKEATGTTFDFKGKHWQMGAQTVYAGNGLVDKNILKYLKTL